MKRKSVLPILFLLFSWSLLSYAQTGSQETLRKDVSFLASNKLKGRAAGSKQEFVAAKYIAKRFEEIGLKAVADEGTYFQEFLFNPDLNTDSSNTSKKKNSKLIGRNVVGWIDHGGNNTIIIGAHYDHLGMGEHSSLSVEKAVHNGADDNASGVGAMLWLAQELISYKKSNNNFLFIAFTAEELGLLGSKYYIENAVSPMSKVSCMINMDMIGRLNDAKELTVQGVGTSPKWPSILKKVESGGLKLVQKEAGLGPSDHASFYLSGIPVLSFFTGAHADYHKPSDDADKINYEGIVMISTYIKGVIYEMNDVLKLAFSKTVDGPMQEKRRSKYKVTLGVMPDYAFSGSGMRIDGVISGHPAEKAGMQNGDIVIKLGAVEVSDLRTYMKALGQFDSGDKTTVKYDRDGTIMEAELEF